ncbi:MAG: alanine--tRNA ligase [Thermoanaerobaculia bacterium]
MRSAEIRQSFLTFFRERGHRQVPSSPLVPHGDATLLFTNAGMVQFKDYFTGAATPEFARAVTSQKCLRVSGKHNDLENVGPSPRHHTFFEMLGNFSFGDYFKAEAIEFGWELVTKGWGLDSRHLFASVFEQDEEAEKLWLRISGLPAERVVRCGEKDNFWAMGETGPCGPCSEIFVDRHPELPRVSWEEGTDSGRYLEIWNLVFMQFERSKAEDGSIVTVPLPRPSIDTGAGLERVSAVIAGVDSNYDTDLFRPILQATSALAGVRYGAATESDVSMRVVADHLRATAFLLADGVIPSNEGRGYVLRRLLRRAVRHGMRLGFEEPFLCRLLPTVDEAMAGFYPELGATRAASESTLRTEEEKFLATVAAGSRHVQEAIEEAKRSGGRALSGEQVFRLYDTHGLPIQLLREIAEEERFSLDEAGFERALEGQRERSRAATGDSQRNATIVDLALLKADSAQVRTVFEGYEELAAEGVRVLAAVGVDREPNGGANGAEGAELSASIATGQSGVVVLDRTVFYAESGGQVGDRGEMCWNGGRALVTDTTRDNAGRFRHHVTVVEGRLESPYPPVDLAVSRAHRLPTQRNHTATHLLHAALREVLGTGVRQAGSLVAPDHLRFDFTYGKPLTDEERSRVESLVDAWILRAVPTRIVEGRSYDEAVAAGAMALFGEKYGDRVRTVEVPGFSLELCGGCHVGNTGEIGPFVLRAERGVASGVRRIEALTGTGAIDYLRGRDRAFAAVEAALGSSGERAEPAVAALRREIKERDAELAKLRLAMVSGGGADADGESEVDGVRLSVREVPPASPAELRQMADTLRDRLGSGVVVLGTRSEGKVSLIAAVTPDLKGRIPAGRLLRSLAALVGGSGGGRDDFAQAGGKEPDRLPEALAAVPAAVSTLLAGGS